jgi:hypothetical protein
MITLPRGLLPLLAFTLAAPGCVRRTITITSEPSGAIVWLNDREVGRTPVDVEFVYYGEYAVRLVKDGYEPMLTSGHAKAPVWDMAGPDLFAEVMPAELRSRVRWHYSLEPTVEDRPGLVDRAEGLRAEVQPDEE